jgi:hypothetical protein
MRTTSDSISFGATAGDTNFTLQFNLPGKTFCNQPISIINFLY